MDVTRMFLFLALGHSVSSLELTGPPVHDARLGSDTRVPCRFTVDNPPVDLNHLTIFWQFLDKEILIYNKTVRTTSPRYSLSTEALTIGIADLAISNVQVSDGGRYKCSVTYGSEQKEREVRMDVGAPPQVTMKSNMATLNERVDLVCIITGFYPSDFFIDWLKSGEKLENNIVVGDPWRNPDRTFSVNSTVTTETNVDGVKELFSCRVQHKYLKEPLQKDFLV